MAEMKEYIRLIRGIRKITPYPAALLLGLMLLGSPVLAQDDPSSDESASSEDEFLLEDVMVTGSLIRTSGMDTPTPVTVVDLEQIELLSPTTVIEGMALLPQFAGSNTTQFTGGFFQTTGAGTLNLRNLQGKRTLQLLNGRRMVQSTIFGGPDINLFPKNLIASVETVTGGASAAYGTNAVAGVVNFILDTQYEGIKVSAQYGETARGHNDNYEYAVAGGFTLSDKTHVLFSFEKSRQDPIWNKLSEYGWYDGSALVNNPDPDAGSSPDNPFYIKVPWVQSVVASLGGILHFPASAGGPYVFVAPGEAIPLEMGDPCSYFLDNPAFPFGCSTADGGYSDDYGFDQQITPDSGRENYFGYIEHEFNDNLMVFGQALYGKADFTDRNFGGLFPNPPLGIGRRAFTIYSGNPFLPADMQQIMDDNGLESVLFSRIGSTQDIDFAYTTQNTETLSLTGGFEYEVDSGFFEGWKVKSYYQYGETDVEAIQKGGIRLDRIYLAADVVIDPATGQPACNVTVTSGLYPDCVPLNLFGEGAASAEAIDWVTGFEPGVTINANGFLSDTESIPYTYTSSENKQRIINIKQHIFDVTADGEIYEGWGAGPINMGIGYTYRKEEFVQVVEIGPGGNINMDPRYRPVMANDPALGIRGVPGGNAASGNSVEIQFSNVPFARGDQDVHEVFTEFLVPLIAKRPLIEQLNFSGAARWANYSGSGTNWSWKTGLDWALFDQLRLRGTISQDVRAATMGEKFDRTGGLSRSPGITDWLIDPAGDVVYTVTTFSNGSPDIQPEEGKTHTIGVVYRPNWLEGLDLSVDYYKIKITDNINQLYADEVVDRCYLDNDANMCAMIIRGGDPVEGPGGEPINRVSLVGRPYFNQAALLAKGVDFEVSYSRDVDWFGGGESVSLRLYANNRIERSDIADDGTKDERQGELGLPEWQGILSGTYRRGPLGFFAQARYTGETLKNEDWNFNGESERWDVADNIVDSTILVDARVNYIFDLFGGFLDLYGTVNNVFDKDPEESLAAQYNSFFVQAPGLGHVGDLRGRRWVIGARFEFEM
jgi:iron complex outermembrane receptor protein